MSSLLRSTANIFKSSRLTAFTDKFKGKRFEKISLFWKGIYYDYREVGRDVIAECKTKPKKTVGIATVLGILYIGLQTNPDEEGFRTQLQEDSNRLGLVSDAVRNPTSDTHIQFLWKCQNEGILRRISLGFFSIMWTSDYSSIVSLYQAQCSYLKPQLLSFHRRVVDIGCFGSWHVLRWKMINFDVNPNEWVE